MANVKKTCTLLGHSVINHAQNIYFNKKLFTPFLPGFIASFKAKLHFRFDPSECQSVRPSVPAISKLDDTCEIKLLAHHLYNNVLKSKYVNIGHPKFEVIYDLIHTTSK